MMRWDGMSLLELGWECDNEFHSHGGHPTAILTT